MVLFWGLLPVRLWKCGQFMTVDSFFLSTFIFLFSFIQNTYGFSHIRSFHLSVHMAELTEDSVPVLLFKGR